jgi:hypothetical protein
VGRVWFSGLVVERLRKGLRVADPLLTSGALHRLGGTDGGLEGWTRLGRTGHWASGAFVVCAAGPSSSVRGEDSATPVRSRICTPGRDHWSGSRG